MALPRKSVEELLAAARRYSTAHQAPVQTVVKEMLHFEVLQALLLSGALSSLVFQGGTCLRLVYAGNRYSEDLDFAGGPNFDPRILGPFQEVLEQQLARTFGLRVAVTERVGEADADGITVARWQARIEVPQANPALPQKQVINVEVASVPAHDVDLRPVRVTYPELMLGARSLMVPAESATEILADKIKAIVTRPYLKARDIWDMKFLTDTGVLPNHDLVRRKVADYGLSLDGFVQMGQARLADLRAPEVEQRFLAEMSRFVDAPQVQQLRMPGIVDRFVANAHELVRASLEAMTAPARAAAVHAPRGPRP